MKNPILIIAALFCICFSSFAQDKNDDPSFEGFNKNISYKFKSFTYDRGFRYDMRLNRGRMDGLGFAVGLSSFNGVNTENNISNTERVLSVPVELNYIFGKRRNGFVTGLGVLPTYNKDEVIRKSFDGSDIALRDVDIIGGYAVLGYRYTPLDNGFTFQLNLNPTILKDGSFNTRMGVSIGYTFK